VLAGKNRKQWASLDRAVDSRSGCFESDSEDETKKWNEIECILSYQRPLGSGSIKKETNYTNVVFVTQLQCSICV